MPLHDDALIFARIALEPGLAAHNHTLFNTAVLHPAAYPPVLQEYKFQVQVPGKEDNKLLTVGRAELDMSHYVLAEATAQSKMIPIMFKVGVASTGYLKVSITAEVVTGGGADGSDDGMTEVSGMTGMTANLGEDQDLTGEARQGRPAKLACVHHGSCAEVEHLAQRIASTAVAGPVGCTVQHSNALLYRVCRI